MCGVAAAWTRAPLSVEQRRGALSALTHRGPDGSGEVSVHGRAVWLGHTRLSIVAPEDGRQPLVSEDGRVHAVVNGEIYGFEAQRADLSRRGHRFATGSDSEVLLHLYEELGLPFVESLCGELAFVLFDAADRRLVAGRDRFGVKPLCYAERDGDLFLASEAKALFALGVDACWDEDAFLHASVHQYLPEGRTLFAGVRQIPPGHLLIAEEGRALRIVKYWDHDMPASEGVEDDSVDEPHATREVARTLEEAVRTRLRADVPVAFALSGGLDSASIAAIASRHSKRPIHTFGVSFEHPPYDEEASARTVAAHIGAVHHVVRVTQEDLIDALPDAVAHSEGLAINGQLPAKLLLARAIRSEGFPVVLTGEGADELFFGYPHLVQDFATTAPRDEALGIRRRIGACHGASRGVMLPLDEDVDATRRMLLPISKRLGMVPTFLRAKAGFGHRMSALLDGRATERMAARPPLAVLLDGFDVEGQLRGRGPAEKSAYLWTHLALAGYILRTLGDGTEMAASVEGRTPFLDHRLHSVAKAIRPDLKIRRGVEKHVLREAVRDLLPESTRTRPKHPFLAPPLCLHGSPRSWALVRDVLSSTALGDVPFIDRRRVHALLDDLERAPAAQRTAAEPILFTLLTACLLARRFRLGNSR